MTLSEEVEGVLHRAFLAACEAGHAEITSEHLALELIVEDETCSYLMRCGTDLVAVESRLRDHLEGMEPGDDPEADAQPGDAFQRVVDAAMQRTDDDGRDHLMLRDLFFALIDERDCTASVAILEATREPQIFEELRSYPWEEE